MMRRTLGAPLGGTMRGAHQGLDCSALSLMTPPNFGYGAGSCLLLTVVVACFGRAISEVGAVMMVGGNIDGFTRVMTTAIALETSKGDLPLALALGFVLLAIVGVLNVLLALGRHWHQRYQTAQSPTLRGWVT
mgnify:CR=1 FL=1